MAAPPICAANPFSIRVEPNPACCGVSTDGSSDSHQCNFTLSTGLITQVTVTRPAGPDNAPYFAALVASSCRTSDSITTAREDIGIESPSVMMRSGIGTGKGLERRVDDIPEVGALPLPGTPHVMRSPSETRRAPNLARSAGSAPSRTR